MELANMLEKVKEAQDLLNQRMCRNEDWWGYLLDDDDHYDVVELLQDMQSEIETAIWSQTTSGREVIKSEFLADMFDSDTLEGE